MKNHLKVITNLLLTSISLSIAVGTFLRIIGPIYQNNQNNILGNSTRLFNKKITNKNYPLFLFNKNKIGGLTKLEKLIISWENHIRKNSDLEVSCFFLSLDNKIYAEINSDIQLPAASSIKVPILIVLLTLLDKGEILWNEELMISEDVIGSGSGWMAYEEIGVKFPLFEVASEMIRSSDNTATNLIIKRLGGVNLVNKKFKELGLKNTQIKNYLPDLDGTNLTSTKDLTIAMALVDNGFILTSRSRDIFKEIMRQSKTNNLIPSGILKGLGKKSDDIDYYLSLKGYTVHNKTGGKGISFSDTGVIHTPSNSRAFASFIVKGPLNDPRSTELIRNLSAELVPFLQQNQKIRHPN